MKQTTSPQQLRQAVSAGLLSFPLTDFDSTDAFDPAAYARRLEWLAGYGSNAIFPAGGAGEFFSLTGEEYTAVLTQAVSCSRGVAPVIAASGYGTRMAVALAQQAERLGADGVLLLPPYLTEGSQQGLHDHVATVCAATRLGVIVYNRANMRLKADTLERLAERCPNLVGFKDGVGDLEELLRIRTLLGERLAFINGMPTAEVYAEAFLGAGVPVYSSAIFNFVPRSAMAYHRAVIARDRAGIDRFNREFLIPYASLRSRQPGYAVSIIKAGAEIVGRGAGAVRPPLSAVTGPERAALEELIVRLGPQD